MKKVAIRGARTAAAGAARQVEPWSRSPVVEGFVLAIDFGGSKVLVATATLAGEVHGSRCLPVGAGDRNAMGTFDNALEAASDLVAQASASGLGQCLAVGVVCPGVVGERGVDLAPSLPGWDDVAVVARAQEILGIQRVVAGNDVKAAALAEWRFGALRGADPALYINLGTGVSAALVIGGRVLAGVHNAAGEIGYGWTSPMSVTGGVTPTLEERVGGRAIGRSASELLRSPVSAAQAFASKDARVRWLVRGALNGLALALGDLVLAVDPERVAIGGGLMNSQGDVLDAVNAHLKHLPFRPAVVPATFLTTASLQGAVALAIDATRSGPSETTLRWTRRG